MNTKRWSVTGQAASTTLLLYSRLMTGRSGSREYGPSREAWSGESGCWIFVDIARTDQGAYYPAGRGNFSVGKADSADDDVNSKSERLSDENTEYRLKNSLSIPTEDKIYFRTGKQVLKWGRSYFWNPTDLINVEKDF